jgi:hypothetical protein
MGQPLPLWSLSVVERNLVEMRRLNVPDVGAMCRWLCSSEVVKANGAVVSWSNPDHPGYDYPEAAGLWLSAFPWLCSLSDVGQVEDLRHKAYQVAENLVGAMHPSGGVGRGEHVYVFDSAVALSGLLRYVEQEHQWAGITPASLDLGTDGLNRYIVSRLEKSIGAEPLAEEDEDRWSLRFGPHLLKTILGLFLYARRNESGLPQLACEGLSKLSQSLSGILSSSSPIYVHALCYALEGLWLRKLVLGEKIDEHLQMGLDILAEVQQDSGGIPAYIHDDLALGPCRSDATAQAIRLWTLAGSEVYVPQITRAVCFLRDMQAPSGGLRYQEGSDDINTWATIFAAQAVDWYVRSNSSSGALL